MGLFRSDEWYLIVRYYVVVNGIDSRPRHRWKSSL